MVLVAEVNGLVYRHVDLIDEVNAIDIEHYSQNTGHNEEAGEYAGLRSPVGTAREYLSHIRFSCGFYEGRGLKNFLRSRGHLRPNHACKLCRFAAMSTDAKNKIGTFRFFRRIYIWLADFCSLTSDIYYHIILLTFLEFGKSFHGNIGYRQVVQ